MPKKKTIYYAHPIDTWGEKSKLKHLEKTIQLALKCRGYKVINPFDKEAELNVKYKVREYYDFPTKQHAREIKQQDFILVENCDEFFAWIPKDITAIGTVMEIDHAIKLKKRIIILTYRPHPFLYTDVDIDELYLSIEDFLKNKPFWKNNIKREECIWNLN